MACAGRLLFSWEAWCCSMSWASSSASFSGDGDMGGWTVDTVRRFLQRQLDDHRMLADERQLNTEKRFELVNEFRQALLDQTKNYVTRSEWEAGHARVVERLEELSERLNQAEGRGAGLHAGWLYLLGFITALGTVVSLAHIILT